MFKNWWENVRIKKF